MSKKKIGAAIKMEEHKLYSASKKVDITPPLPCALFGQYYRRIANEVFSPLTANICVFESVSEKGSDSAVFVACDLIGVPVKLLSAVRRFVSGLNPSIDVSKIIMSAIHTHTAPLMYQAEGSEFWGSDFDFSFSVPNELDPDVYGTSIAKAIAEGIVDCWNKKEPVKISTGFDYLSIAYNRRTVYSNGAAQMYGSTARDDFMMMESGTDSGIHFLTVHNNDKLKTVFILVPCPSQVLEHKSYVASDFWHNVREKISKSFGDDVVVLGLCSAAGDLSPRDLVRTAMDELDMHDTKMYNPEGAEYIANRIKASFDLFMQERDKEETAGLSHVAKTLPLTLRTVTKEEVDWAAAGYKKLRAKHRSMDEFSEFDSMWISIYCGITERYKLQQKTKTYPVEVHCLRIGNAVFATNPFELYHYYADKIRSKTKNPNTFVVQLACGYEGYLPTKTAVERGGYSSYVCNGVLGPEGGEEMVYETLQLIKEI